MARVHIRKLTRLSHVDVVSLVGGYRSDARYVVKVSERRERVKFTLQRTRTPYAKTFPHPAKETAKYREVVRMGWSLGAFEGPDLVGLALAEPLPWNRSVRVWELGVAPTHRKRGIGRRLVEELSRRAREAGYRVLVCETQTTNAPAIDFYRAAGFHLEGVDLSYYSNEDLRRGEVAIFMKKRIPGRRMRRAPRPRTSK